MFSCTYVHLFQKLPSSYEMGILIRSYYRQILFNISFMLLLFFYIFFSGRQCIEIQIMLKISTREVNIGIFLYACNDSVTNLTVSLSFDLQNFTFLYESAWLFKKTASRCISPFCFLLHSYMFNFQYLIYPVKSGKQIIYGLISC